MNTDAPSLKYHSAMRFRIVVLQAAVAALFVAGAAHAQSAPEPGQTPLKPPSPPVRAFLSWHAPYGSPGATDTLTAPCSDDGGVDTLYLSFQPGRNAPEFYAYGATILFRAAPGDTLGPNWFFGGAIPGHHMKIEWMDNPASADGHRTPWKTAGLNVLEYDRTRGSGRFRFLFAVPKGLADSVSDTVTYALTRLILPRAPSSYEQCNQPICIEWAEGDFTFDLGGNEARYGPGSQRFVSWNSPGGRVCRDFQRADAKPVWRPKPK